MNSQRFGIITFQSQTVHLAELGWKCITQYRNHTHCPQSNQWESNTVITRNDIETFRLVLDDFVHLSDIARCFLNSDNVFKITGQTESGFSSHVNTSTSRYIVKHNREFGCFSHCLVMLVDTFLRRLIIIRYDNEQCINTGHIVVLHTIYHSLGAVTAHTQQDRNTSIHAVNHGAFDFFLLFLAQCRSFSGCTQHAQEIRSILQLIIHQTKQSLVIHSTIFLERSNQCYPHSFQSCLHIFK